MIAIANRLSGAGRHLARLELPAQRVFEPTDIDWGACLEADLIALFGGDGTLQRTTTDLLRWLSAQEGERRVPPLAILPFGTTNMSARNINTAHSRRLALRRLEHIVEHESARTLPLRSRPLLRIETPDALHYGYFLGVGAIANAVQDWRAKRKNAALVNQLRSFVALLQGLRGGQFSTTVRLANRELEVYALLLTTLQELLYGVTPFWGRGRLAETHIRATWIEAGRSGLLRLAPAILRGAPRLEAYAGMGSDGFREVTLALEDAFILDGEVYDSGGLLKLRTEDRLRWLSL